MTGVQTCALPMWAVDRPPAHGISRPGAEWWAGGQGGVGAQKRGGTTPRHPAVAVRSESTSHGEVLECPVLVMAHAEGFCDATPRQPLCLHADREHTADAQTKTEEMAVAGARWDVDCLDLRPLRPVG